MIETQPCVLQAKGIEKRFGNTLALHGVDLRIDAGQCLGLVGRNGAGKSTLVSIFSGLTKPDGGQVLFRGEPAPAVGNIRDWRKYIATVYQHSKIVPQLTVSENVFLGNPKVRNGLVNWKSMRKETQAVIDEWGFEVSVMSKCESLTVEQLQIVEIVRALISGAQCILLDEPTAALEKKAVDRLFERVRQLVDGGVSVMYISHHLEEVFEICDRVVVMRDGGVVKESPIADITKDEMVLAMVGDDTHTQATSLDEKNASPSPRSNIKGGASALVIRELGVTSSRGDLDDFSLTVAPGELVGVTGLMSGGVATLGAVVAGILPFQKGEIEVDGKKLASGRREQSLRLGIGFVPEDRQAAGFVAPLSIAENASMTIVRRLSNFFGMLRPSTRVMAVDPFARDFDLVASSLRQPAGELSGGNQQKVTVIRALISEPKVIVAVTPTRGVDVASKQLLLSSLARSVREKGAAMLLCSDELGDLVHCDRVVVLFRGRKFAEFDAAPFDRERLIAATEGLEITKRESQ